MLCLRAKRLWGTGLLLLTMGILLAACAQPLSPPPAAPAAAPATQAPAPEAEEAPAVKIGFVSFLSGGAAAP
ncbi:MAG: hypothetical protein D6791_08705, partial [Chloroflexi bacterium]